MKKYLIIGILLLTGCSFNNKLDYVSKKLDVNLDNCKIESETDTHSGFLGDGDYFSKITCSEDININWKELPLSEELNRVMNLEQCNDKDCKNVYDRYNIPNIENGYYYFLDRHSESKDKNNDKDLNNRSSDNFSVGIYDKDNKILYYYELDT